MIRYGRDYGWGQRIDPGYGFGADAGRGYFPARYGAPAGRYEPSRVAGYGYDRGFYAAAGDVYDYNYKNRWETDLGDPYGDRAAHTPVRVMRGGFRADNRGAGWRGYDRGYGAYPTRAPYDRDWRL